MVYIGYPILIYFYFIVYLFILYFDLNYYYNIFFSLVYVAAMSSVVRRVCQTNIMYRCVVVAVHHL